MGDKSRNIEEAINRIDHMIFEFSGGSDEQSANKQGVSNNNFSVGFADNIGRDVIHVDSTVDVGNMNIDNIDRYQIISLFASVGRLVSEGVDENEDEIEDKLGALAKIGEVFGFADSVVNIASSLGIDLPVPM